MGCIVNGPGESKHANLGISLPGTFEEPVAPVYIDGRLSTTLRGDRIVAEFIVILKDYVASHYQEEFVAAALNYRYNTLELVGGLVYSHQNEVQFMKTNLAEVPLPGDTRAVPSPSENTSSSADSPAFHMFNARGRLDFD